MLVRDDWGVVDVTFGSALGLPEAADLIESKALEHNVPVERISYDRVGIGRDFPLHLARRGLEGCLGYAGAGKPRSSDFRNLRSEAAWRLRRRIDPQYACGRPQGGQAAVRHPQWPLLAAAAARAEGLDVSVSGTSHGPPRQGGPCDDPGTLTRPG